MAWIDQLQQASFRNVAFLVDSIDVSAGDNVVLREYPFQDLPTVFRMGEGAEDIKFSAYVVGDDYTAWRDALREVLSGEGVLVHPTAGSVRVFVAGKYGIKESPTTEGGIARFDLHFVRADARRYPLGAVATPQEAFRKAELAKQAATDSFVAQWKLAEKPGWVAERAVLRLGDAIDTAWAQMASATQALGDYTNAKTAAYQDLRSNLNSLVRTPRLLADAVASLFELPGDLSQARAHDLQAAFGWVFDIGARLRTIDFEVMVVPAVGAGLVMYGAGNASAVGAESAVRSQLARLTETSDQLVEVLATASWVQAGTALALVNYDAALALRQALHAQLTRLLLRASSAQAAAALPGSSLHDALLGLHTAALADLQARGQDLARLTTYTPQAVMPVWLISYQLFGTADYADEILAMNPHIRHPLLVPAGRALRIVRHD